MKMLFHGKSTLLYGSATAIAVFALQWLEYQYAVRLFSTELYIVLVAILFTGAGIWIGTHLGRPQTTEFQKNERAIETLGLTNREIQVLELLAEGDTNQQIADQLFVAPSTVKTHLVHLYQKLDVLRRTQAIQKAKHLKIIS